MVGQLWVGFDAWASLSMIAIEIYVLFMHITYFLTSFFFSSQTVVKYLLGFLGVAVLITAIAVPVALLTNQSKFAVLIVSW